MQIRKFAWDSFATVAAVGFFDAEWEKTMHEHSNYFAIRFIRDFWKLLWRCACIAEDKLQH